MADKLTHAQYIEKINAFLEKYQSDLSYCHGIDHAKRVTKLALKIGAIEKADCQLIEVAALLHDVGVVPLAWSRRALGKDENDFQKFLGTYALPSAEHGEVGALIAERFLEQIGYPESNIKRVAMIIKEHTTNRQTTLESRIVNDADRLEILGATWVARAFQRTNAFDRSISIESIPEKYLKRKERLPGSFHTKTAEKMTAERYKFLESFIEQFQRELRLEA